MTHPGKLAIPPSQTMQDIESHSVIADGRRRGEFLNLSMGSAFQPIISLPHRRAVGYEALLRARAGDGQAVAPPTVFDMAQGESECVFLDRLCRYLHVGNFLASAAAPDTWLFLNVNPLVSVQGREHGTFFEEMLAHYGIPAHRIVIEVLEGQIEQEDRLAASVDYYKSLGCLVAIDDFGAGHSNFDRIWRIGPHIVKLDRAMIAQAATNSVVRRLLPRLVSMVHESGSLALMEGIETEEQALISMDAGFDFVQGYYFGRPADTIGPLGSEMVDICDRFRSFSDQENQRYRQELHRYETLFGNAARLLGAGRSIEPACRDLLEQPRVERCYLLDMEGRQHGANLAAPDRLRPPNPRFAPLADASGAVWSRKPYFRRAVAAPNQVQISRPYLSITGANMCVTLSILIDTQAGPRIFCLDLDWSDQY
ncbi:MAG: EAL domain-containing protein [Sulfuricella sp.]|nr:EAL domain-containing protein [Sulfuricella sp.]